MVDVDTMLKIALSLPEAEDRTAQSGLQFYVRGKQFAWTYLDRVEIKGRRRPRLDVLAVRCAAEEKEGLLASAPEKFFTTDHYRGFPAILVRLDKIAARELRERCQAPRALVQRLK